LLRLAFMLLLLLVTGCDIGRSEEPERAAAKATSTAGIEFRLPAGWHDASPPGSLSPEPIRDPLTRLAVSSGPIRHGGAGGCHVSSYDFPDDEVALVLVEWTTPLLLQGTKAPLRPERFTAASLPLQDPPAIECFDGPGGSAQFVEAGRMFGAYVLLGRDAPRALADEALAVLDTLRIELRQARPVELVALAQARVEHCRRSRLLRSICPTKVPRVRAPYLSHLARDLLRPARSLDAFSLERGGEDPARPERNRPPRMAHIALVAGETEQIAPWAEPWDQLAVALRDGLLRAKRDEPISFGLVTWGSARGLLFLVPPFPTGGSLGNHLVFVRKSGPVSRAVSLHAWEPLTEAAATLRAITLSAG
jgi:hypothetical protein